jgi:predicted aldo/keto reductase-like oxidoreductase
VIYRRFGRTELQMPAFSCGGMRYQQSWNRAATVTEVSQRNLQATIDRALSLGINHIETARGYGTSEAQLGPALADHPRDSFILQTKIVPTEDPRDFERFFAESLQRLRVSQVDLFSLHGLNNAAVLGRALRDGGCLEVAERLRREGKIRHIGFSTHAPTALILEAINTGRFDYVNLHYYYIFQDNLPALRAARLHDMGVFIISPSDKGGRLYRAPEKLRALCAPLSPMVFNDLFCLSHPEVHTLSIGAARPTDFDEHLTALPLMAGDPDRAAATVAPVVQRLDTAYRLAVGDDFARRWRQGLREWDTLPGQINVRRILWLRNLVLAFDLLDFAQERYAAMSPDDNWVPGARAADVPDADLVAALPDFPFRAALPGLMREAHALLHNPGVAAGP